MPSVDRLTDAHLRRAVPGPKPLRLFDGRGLYLEVAPTGGKWWRLKYRFGGKEKRLSLGVYPDVPLKTARELREAARRLLAAGTDPGAARKADRAAAEARAEVARRVAKGESLPGSFQAVATEWLQAVHEAKVSAGHAERTRIRFEQEVFPWIGALHIAEVEAPQLLECLRRVIGRGAIETAHRVKDACGQVFRYGIATGACKRNPAADLRDALPPVPTRHHAAIVDPKAAAELLRAMAGYVGHPITRAALRLSALLFLRPGELRQLEWRWVDIEGAMVTLPADLMKRQKAEKASGAPHLVPLAPQAIALLLELRPLTGSGRFVFPGLLSDDRPMSENTVRAALRRMGYGNNDMTAHGFRAMARTMAAERLGVAPEVIEAQLAHAVPDALGRAYNRTQYLDQRRELMERWADYLDRLQAGAEVVPLRAA